MSENHSHDHLEKVQDAPSENTPLNMEIVRERIASVWGRDYWRSLSQIVETPDFMQHFSNEFPDKARALPDEVTRRDFMKIMGASLALAGLAGCTRQPLEKIIPFVKQPENMIPGKPLYFATAMPFHGSALGLLAESHMGRPTHLEGNPMHPESLGATDVFSQASILSLYDPDRSQTPKNMGRISSWDAFAKALTELIAIQRAKKGAGLRILTGSVSSPTLQRQLEAVKAEFPESKWHRYEAAHDDNARAGAKKAFGEAVQPVYKLENADVIVSLDSDFLNAGAGHVRYTREFAKKRQVLTEKATMNRLYVVESTPTSTGASADHRLAVRAGDIEVFTAVLAAQLGVSVTGFNPESVKAHSRWINAVARDLKKNAGKSLVIAGEYQSADVHAMVHAINAALGNAGKTVVYTQTSDTNPQSSVESLRELVKDMEAGKVELLLTLGVNPVFDAPSDFNFLKAMEKVQTRVHHGLYEDETSNYSHWHLPESHYLESWSDARSYDGTVVTIQPLIEPLFGGRSAHEILAALLGKSGVTGLEIVQETWKAEWQKAGLAQPFDKVWKRTLHDGLIENSAFAPKAVSAKNAIALKPAANTGIEVIFRPDPTVFDGRFANNAWLQELPKPLTKITWDNTVWISPRLAEALKVQNNDVVKIELNGKTVEAPVWVVPGHAENSATVFFGYGRTVSGKVGTGAGFNVYNLRSSVSPWQASGAKFQKTGATHKISATQEHHGIEGRDHVRVNTLEHHNHHPDWVNHVTHEYPAGQTFYAPLKQSDDYAWAMAIDMNACTGCNACVVACQSENNIPVVGKNEVARGREMHWLRIDHYYSGSPDAPEQIHQPVTCMHCEHAPCEPVCPVGATTHSSEGINEMTYNRCVGTRYCSNNCPYKVRRFNFFEYADHQTEILKFLRNPDVTVRSRGVMEKCTYCVQRVNVARIQASKENRKIKEGEVVTACQSSCAAGAIVFGNLKDPESKVSKIKATPLNYGMLTELNTKPRTSYLAKLRNVNPEIEAH